MDRGVRPVSVSSDGASDGSNQVPNISLTFLQLSEIPWQSNGPLIVTRSPSFEFTLSLDPGRALYNLQLSAQQD